jgi:uncharacterized cupin superfamily protein
MVRRARLDDTGNGKVPVGDGWFVLHASEAPWFGHERFGGGCRFEGTEGFPQVGINLRVLEPGKPACLYHREDAQEDFLVVSGECTIVVEEEEHALREGHFIHCPAGTNHVFVGAGDGPCIVLMIGHRPPESITYPVSEAAARHGASVDVETNDPREAYGERKLAAIDPAWP